MHTYTEAMNLNAIATPSSQIQVLKSDEISLVSGGGFLKLIGVLAEMASRGGTGTCSTGYEANGVCNIK